MSTGKASLLSLIPIHFSIWIKLDMWILLPAEQCRGRLCWQSGPYADHVIFEESREPEEDFPRFNLIPILESLLVV